MYSNLQILKNLIISTPQKHRLKEVIRTRRSFQGLCDLGGRLGRWEMMLHQKPTSHFSKVAAKSNWGKGEEQPIRWDQLHL